MIGKDGMVERWNNGMAQANGNTGIMENWNIG
jgi:hypothetical protein